MPFNRTEKWRLFWIFVAVAIVSAAIVPIRSLNCPAWEVWVTDQGGRPVPDMTVRLTYRNYSAEAESHEFDTITDAQGHVAFSAQTVSASLARRMVAILSSVTAAGVHASFGPHATVFAFGRGLQGFAVDQQRNVIADWTGKSDRMESRIVVALRRQ
jgi:hypothetical protein